MNKKFLILPIVSALLLAGCTLGGKKSNRKKKSSSAVITSSVTSGGNTSQGGGGNTSQGGGGNTSQGGTSQQPGGSSSTPAPTEWSPQEIADFNTVFHGVIPPFVPGGIDSDLTDLDEGYFCSYAMTEAACEAYYNGLDSTWVIAYDAQGYEEKHKNSADGAGYVNCYEGADYSGNLYICFEWYDVEAAELSSIALSGTYPTTFEEGDAFSHTGLVVTATYSNESTKDVSSSATFSGYNMSTPGSQTVTVTYQEGGVTKTTTYSITVTEVAKKTVTYKANGGTGDDVTEQAPFNKPYTLKAADTFAAPAEKGFKEWNTEADGSGTKVAAGGTYTVTDDVTFFAIWANKFTVSFAAGEGSGAMEPVKVGEGGSIAAAPACTFTAPTGKEFDKWVIGTEAVTFPYTVKGDVTLTATWKDKATPVADKTVTKSFDTIKSELSWVVSTTDSSGKLTGGEQYLNWNFDEVVAVAVTYTANPSASYDASGRVWGDSNSNYRLYESEATIMTLTVPSQYKIKTINFTYTNKNNGVIVCGTDQIASGSDYTVNASTAAFSATHSSGTSKAQARISSITITYGAA